MPYTPEQNASREKEIRTLTESARSLIHSKKLTFRLLAEALNTDFYTLNRSEPNILEGKNPCKMLFKKEIPNIDHRHIFKAKCLVHVPKQKRRKCDKMCEKNNPIRYWSERDG